jgi:hypothetical protein
MRQDRHCIPAGAGDSPSLARILLRERLPVGQPGFTYLSSAERDGGRITPMPPNWRIMIRA